ncbi:hypothetical protein ABZ725_49240 [Streptomyces sp. NPDC006872]|uniref:hypothetical protein n=1 Tax=Streptomyces sp. NPDC006872 TaxID=3155720 RepID=UPI0033DB1609
MTTTLEAVEDPATTPQDRQAVIESTKELTATLAVISDDSAPDELQEQLTPLVKQVTATLEVGTDPSVPPEERSRILLVVKRTTSVLGAIRSPETPQNLRGQLIAIVTDANSALEMSRGGEETGTALMLTSTSAELGLEQDTPHSDQPTPHSDTPTPDADRQELVDDAQQGNQLVKKMSDPRTSPQERAEAREELRDRTPRMKGRQEAAASAHSLPEAPLGKAAEACTNAIFNAKSERELAKGLEDLVPRKWDTEGVKDFWKAKEERDDSLDILAQLQNDERTHAPFPVAPLITELAELIPGDDLLSTLGRKPASSCRQTAVYLQADAGITVTPWLMESDGG